ncbi:MAG: hypothetical protein CSA53_05715 [Gammaproteobacteria bacterium]|nr:MAG: hypothetical protein CSA53_05715 [Gammaproteobacteria bacterium]
MYELSVVFYAALAAQIKKQQLSRGISKVQWLIYYYLFNINELCREWQQKHMCNLYLFRKK